MDIGIRAISRTHNYKIFIIDLTQTISDIVKLQGTNPLASIILGKVTLANALLGIDLKNGETISNTILPNAGHTGKIISEMQNNRIRAYIQNPSFSIDQMHSEDFTNPYEWALGQNGVLTVVRALRGFDPYISKTLFNSVNIDRNFMDYNRQSTQAPNILVTKVVIGKNFELEKAVGLYIEPLPDHSDEDISFLEKKMISTSKIVEELVNSTNYEQFLADFDPGIVTLAQIPLEFGCTCSYQKSLQSIALLGKNEMRDILHQNEPIEIVCDFCKTKYIIGINDVQKLFSSMVE